MRHVRTQHLPIVERLDGQPPQWVVECLDCGWKHDAHGPTEYDAISAWLGLHALGHRLKARTVDLNQHPLYD